MRAKYLTGDTIQHYEGNQKAFVINMRPYIVTGYDENMIPYRKHSGGYSCQTSEGYFGGDKHGACRMVLTETVAQWVKFVV